MLRCPLGSLVDWEGLAKTVAAALVAGVGITAAFSVTLVGFIRASESRRDGHDFRAGAYAALGALGLVVSLGGVVWGVVLITSKG